jgi:hypothetical protein
MDPAVIGVGSSCSEGHWEGESNVVDARIEYSIRTIGIAGGHAVIVAGPGPIDDVADLDGDRARVEVGPALSHADIRRSRGSEDWQQDQKYKRQSAIHFEGFCCRAASGRRRTGNMCAAIDLG